MTRKKGFIMMAVFMTGASIIALYTLRYVAFILGLVAVALWLNSYRIERKREKK